MSLIPEFSSIPGVAEVLLKIERTFGLQVVDRITFILNCELEGLTLEQWWTLPPLEKEEYFSRWYTLILSEMLEVGSYITFLWIGYLSIDRFREHALNELIRFRQVP